MLKKVLTVVLLSVASSQAAIVTKTLATCDDKKIRWEVDYDDVEMKIVAFRQINGTKKLGLTAEIYGVGREPFFSEQDKKVSNDDREGGRKEITISKTGNNSIPVFINSKGKLDGFDGQFGCGEN